MIRRSFLLLFPALAIGQRRQKRSRDMGYRLEVLEFSARRTTDGRLNLDGRARNVGERPIAKLEFRFHLLAIDGAPLSTQKGAAAETDLDPGQETQFEWQMRDQVRAVQVKIEAVNRSGDYVDIQNAGPYPIE